MFNNNYNTLHDLSPIDFAEQIFLPPAEYAVVMKEFNSSMSEEDRKHRIVTKAIGDYWYTIINLDYNDYIVIRKTPIDGIDDLDEEWRDLD